MPNYQISKSSKANQVLFWNIQLEAIPNFMQSPLLKTHLINSIPVTTFNSGSIEYDHTSIEWNDFNGFIMCC